MTPYLITNSPQPLSPSCQPQAREFGRDRNRSPARGPEPISHSIHPGFSPCHLASYHSPHPLAWSDWTGFERGQGHPWPTSTDGFSLRLQLWSSSTMNAQGQDVLLHHGGSSLSQMSCGPQPGRMWLDPETVKSLSLSWLVLFFTPFSSAISISSLPGSVCSPGSLALQDSTITSLGLMFKEGEFHLGTWDHTGENTWLGSIAGAQSRNVSKNQSPQFLRPKPSTLGRNLRHKGALQTETGHSPQRNQAGAVGGGVGGG